MVKLYTDRSLVDTKRLIKSNNKFFSLHIRPWGIEEELKQYIKKIILSEDKSEVIENTPPKIRTRHGFTVDIDMLSTGLKTLLNIYYISQNMSKFQGYSVDITECGRNYLLYIFKLANKHDINLILRHLGIPEFDGLEIRVNDQYTFTTRDQLLDFLHEQVDEGLLLC